MFGKNNHLCLSLLLGACLLLAACGPDRRVTLAERLMAERQTDSAVAVMYDIDYPSASRAAIMPSVPSSWLRLPIVMVS